MSTQVKLSRIWIMPFSHLQRFPKSIVILLMIQKFLFWFLADQNPCFDFKWYWNLNQWKSCIRSVVFFSFRTVLLPFNAVDERKLWRYHVMRFFLLCMRASTWNHHKIAPQQIKNWVHNLDVFAILRHRFSFDIKSYLVQKIKLPVSLNLIQNRCIHHQCEVQGITNSFSSPSWIS